MIVHCPQCTSFARMTDEAATIECGFCGARFAPTAAQRRRFRRERERAALRAARAPLDAAASVALFFLTAAILVVTARAGGGPAGWLLPVWVALLGLELYLIRRLDRDRTFVMVPRTTVAVLAVLTAPLIYALLPHGRPTTARAPEPPPVALVASSGLEAPATAGPKRAP